MKEVRTTLLIFGWTIPCLAVLWLLNLLYFDRFFETPLYSPHAPIDYPFSFAIALCFSLCYGAIALWLYREQKSDFNPLIVCLGAFVGLLGSIFFITKVDNYNRSIGATVVFVLGTTVLSVVGFIIILLFIFAAAKKTKEEIYKLALETIGEFAIALLVYLFPFTLVFIATIFLACQFPIKKPPLLGKRLLYASPLFVSVLLPYFLLISTYFPPGSIVPIHIRQEWGIKNFPYTYESESERLKACDLIKKEIGNVTATALVEDNNVFFGGVTAGSNYSMFTLELTGEKGTAIVKTCSSAQCPRTNFIGRIKSNAIVREIDISPCLELNSEQKDL